MRTKQLDDFSKYVIYDDGRIWSLSKKCFMAPSLTLDGYPQSVFVTPRAANGYRKSIKMHRLIAEAFVPNPNGYKEVNHKDGNKLNNHWTNLEWCTRSENIRHCHRLGLRSSRGSNNGNYKTGKYAKC